MAFHRSSQANGPSQLPEELGDQYPKVRNTSTVHHPLGGPGATVLQGPDFTYVMKYRFTAWRGCPAASGAIVAEKRTLSVTSLD